MTARRSSADDASRTNHNNIHTLDKLQVDHLFVLIQYISLLARKLLLLEIDYIIIGAGLPGLVFANTLLSGSDARIALVDHQGVPGGHWTQLADFSRAPPPHSAFGINSFSIHNWRPGTNPIQRDTVLAYCAHILEHHLLRSGRVAYFPKCNYNGDGEIYSIESGQAQKLVIAQRVVNAAETIPSQVGPHIPCFSCTQEVDVLHPREVSSDYRFAARQYDAYCILGAGRSATDAALHLLERKIPHDQIRWVKSRESWVLSTPHQDAPPQNFRDSVAASLRGLRLMSNAQTQSALCRDLEDLGLLLRTSADLEPQGFSPQTITPDEAAKLRTIRRVIRKGHVHAISEIGMILDEGVVPMPKRTLYIDCTGSTGVKAKPPPIFQNTAIQMAEGRLCQPSFSAAIIGAIELLDISDDEKNALCAPLYGSDMTTLFLSSILNHHAWFHHGALRKWLEACRLDGFLQFAAKSLNSDSDIPPGLQAIRSVLPRAIINLERLLERTGEENPLLD